MFTFAVNILEQMRTEFFFLGFESKRVCFEVSLVTPCYILIIFEFIEIIAFLAFGTI